MIYLIESSGFKEGDNGEVEYFKLLKIGYTEESRKDSRYTAYKLHNPTIKVLHEIPNADSDKEKRLQYKFRDLRFKEYGFEWFYYSEDIINFFKSIKDPSELDKLPKSSLDKEKYLKYKNIAKKIINYSYPIPELLTADDLNNLREFNKKILDYYNKLVDELGDKIKDVNNVYDYIKKDFGDNSVDNYLKVKEAEKSRSYSENTKINQEVCNFFNVYRTLPNSYSRLKFLCEGGFSEEAIEIILSQFPNTYDIKCYYKVLGPDRLRSLSYNKTNIKRELDIITFSLDLLEQSIYTEFKVGSRYSTFEIKDKLDKIYKKFNYKASPKATDLKNYFEVREMITIVNINGEKKKGRCYELLEKKLE